LAVNFGAAGVGVAGTGVGLGEAVGEATTVGVAGGFVAVGISNAAATTSAVAVKVGLGVLVGGTTGVFGVD